MVSQLRIGTEILVLVNMQKYVGRREVGMGVAYDIPGSPTLAHCLAAQAQLHTGEAAFSKCILSPHHHLRANSFHSTALLPERCSPLLGNQQKPLPGRVPGAQPRGFPRLRSYSRSPPKPSELQDHTL